MNNKEKKPSRWTAGTHRSGTVAEATMRSDRKWIHEDAKGGEDVEGTEEDDVDLLRLFIYASFPFQFLSSSRSKTADDTNEGLACRSPRFTYSRKHRPMRQPIERSAVSDITGRRLGTWNSTGKRIGEEWSRGGTLIGSTRPTDAAFGIEQQPAQHA